ncbi:MAG: helix-turn-helix transcriptional regulator [Alphaproteobacteria bacterium]|nr:helix-turn-helix transcriptional regulator [Alphaproteobacteria bacterium]MBU2095841.1 helix-turn-helix transcriptional regulator [Alphaproteobacteria bacterium]MBU2152022.1 helix-turn-helix transcriptional regulator [Alphaproteobacteria bacterium]MBU2309543.1 helix-turn-helix transcriptional regulator [Alphaproteobacteria bacterium]MBU2365757.1 helix-turn-helix transcriptional regulator [Alphaproteobacteria bacterium]
MTFADAALAAPTPEAASEGFFSSLADLGASYLQTRIYRRPIVTLTSAAHFAAGGIVSRIAPETWRAGSPAFDYVCFENNPLLEAIRGGLTRYRFTDFAPRAQRRYGTYWEAMSEAGIADAVCATSYGRHRTITSLHLGFHEPDLSPDDALAIQLAGLMLTERLMTFAAPPTAEEEVRLTDRERDALAWVAEGKSDWEISMILGLSETTVRFHVDNGRKKLGAVNRAQAVARLAAARML